MKKTLLLVCLAFALTGCWSPFWAKVGEMTAAPRIEGAQGTNAPVYRPLAAGPAVILTDKQTKHTEPHEN